MASGRALLASIALGGVLLAAVVTAMIVLGGSVRFDGWPGSLARDGDERRIALDAGAPDVAGPGSANGRSARGRRDRGRSGSGARTEAPALADLPALQRSSPRPRSGAAPRQAGGRGEDEDRQVRQRPTIEGYTALGRDADIVAGSERAEFARLPLPPIPVVPPARVALPAEPSAAPAVSLS